MKNTCTHSHIRKSIWAFSLLFLSFWGLNANQIPYSEDGNPYRQDHIQIALILDTSGSMDNLIEQARAEFWFMIDDIYNEYEYGHTPILEVALIEYGRSRLGWSNRYMRVVVPFTQDHDWIADELYELRTGGKKEYAGAAVALASHELNWSPDPYAVKSIFIAGNESFRQGDVDYRDAIRWTRERGIVLNTIFAGDYNQGIRLKWEHAARLGNGQYSNIILDRPLAYYDTYYDNDIYALNSYWNDTYIPFGPRADFYWDRYVRQDRWAYNYGAGYACIRTIVKTRPIYVNADWDLVDAIACGRVELRDVPVHHLPPVMRNMNYREREAYLYKKSQQRKELRERITRLSNERRNYIAQHPQKYDRGERRPTVNRSISSSVKQKVRDPKRVANARPHLNKNTRSSVSARPGTNSSREVVGNRSRDNSGVRDSRSQPNREIRTTRPATGRDENSYSGPGARGRQPLREGQSNRPEIQQRNGQTRDHLGSNHVERERQARQAQERAQREARQRAESQRVERERQARQAQARERSQREARQRAESQRVERERQARQAQARERAQREARQRAESQRVERERQARQAQARAQREARQRAESQRVERERQARQAQERAQREARQRAESQRVERERQARQAQAQERAQREARQRAESQRVERERQARQAQARERSQREARQRAESQRVERERQARSTQSRSSTTSRSRSTPPSLRPGRN